jgi:cytidylate kinase
VWTISAQEGTRSNDIAAALARAADVPLIDRETLHIIAHEMDPRFAGLDEMESFVSGRLNLAALSLAMVGGLPTAFYDLQLHQLLPGLGQAVVAEAARRSSVILAPGAFAALRERPATTHVRLWAPLEWRIENYQRQRIADRRSAEKAINRDDALKRNLVKTLYHVDIDDPQGFSIVFDASRISQDRVVDALLAAVGGTIGREEARNPPVPPDGAAAASTTRPR